MHTWPSKKVLKTASFWSKLPNKTKEDRESINQLKIDFGLKVVAKQKALAKDGKKK